MASGNNASRGPPPPPPHGPAAGIIMMDGPQMADNRQFRAPQQQQQQQRPPQPQQKAPIMMNNSTTVSDITPIPQTTEEGARSKLTVFEVFTLRKATPLPIDRSAQPLSSSSARRNSRGLLFSSSSSTTANTRKPMPKWQRITITKEAFDQVDIISKIRSLDRTTRPVTSKKAALAPNQHLQVTKLVDEKGATEFDPAFAWTLAQLERREVVNRLTGRKETEALTLFLKRAPHANISALQLYKSIEAQKKLAAANANRPPQAMGQGQGQQQGGQGGQGGQGRVNQGQGGGQMGPKQGGGGGGGNMGGPFGKNNGQNNGGGRGPKIEIIDPRHGAKSPHFARTGGGARGGKKNFRHHSDSDSDFSLSDSDSDRSYDTDTSLTLSSSRSGARRRRDSGYDRRGSRVHERGDLMIENRRRRSSAGLAYAPDAPRGARALSFERTSFAGLGLPGVGGGGSVKAIEEAAFAAGVVAATKVANADRGGSVASPRAITYRDVPGSHSSIEDTLRGLREMKLREEFEQDALDEARIWRERDRDRERDEYRPADLRREDMIRREDMRMRDAQERLHRDSMSISPLTRIDPIDMLPRARYPSYLLDEDRAYGYLRNPNPNPLRRNSMREKLADRIEFRGYRP